MYPTVIGRSNASPLRPSRRTILPSSGGPASLSSALICSSVAPSKTAVAAFWPFAWSAQPRWVSRIWPMFIRLGTPSGLRMMSTGVPSGRNGMSSAGRIFAITPLVTWRPAIFSPTLLFRFWATDTRTRRLTPGWRSSLSSRRNSRISTTLPRSPWGRRRLEALNSRALSPKIAPSQASLAGLLAEDRPEQALLRGQLGLALRGDLADENVARPDLRPDVDDALLVEVLEGLLADVRDVAGDLFRPELRVARLDLVLLDVDAREEVVLDEAVADDDRVLVVAALPAHERDEHVPAEGELARLGRRAVGDRLALSDAIAHVDDRPLVDAGALVA